MDSRVVLAFLSACALAQSRDILVGRQCGELIFNETKEASPAIWRQNNNVTVEAGTNDHITGIIITDLRPDKDGDAEIVDGGIAQKRVTIELKSPTVLRGYLFQIEVYSESYIVHPGIPPKPSCLDAASEGVDKNTAKPNPRVEAHEKSTFDVVKGLSTSATPKITPTTEAINANTAAVKTNENNHHNIGPKIATPLLPLMPDDMKTNDQERHARDVRKENETLGVKTEQHPIHLGFDDKNMPETKNVHRDNKRENTGAAPIVPIVPNKPQGSCRLQERMNARTRFNARTQDFAAKTEQFGDFDSQGQFVRNGQDKKSESDNKPKDPSHSHPALASNVDTAKFTGSQDKKLEDENKAKHPTQSHPSLTSNIDTTKLTTEMPRHVRDTEEKDKIPPHPKFPTLTSSQEHTSTTPKNSQQSTTLASKKHDDKSGSSTERSTSHTAKTNSSDESKEDVKPVSVFAINEKPVISIQ